MSAVTSPVSAKSGYAGTPQHLKTLDVLGKSKNFEKLSHHDLLAYCELAHTKYYCKTLVDVSVFLEDRYGWQVESREADLEQAWDSLIAEDNKSDDELVITSHGNKETLVDQNSDDIPVIIKGSALSRPVLICQVDDDLLQFAGDSGAVGRIFCDPSTLRLDLKGRQYSGQLTAGPTLMVLNLAPPVGQSSSSKGSGLCARAEVITNEFCHLTFEKDLHGTLQGVYTGEDADNQFERDEETDSEEEQGPNKRKKSASSGKKSKASTTGADDGGNPKISTITQRKRKSTGKKAGTSSKKSKSK